MASYAPELPTTAMLAASHPLTAEAELEITMARGRISDLLAKKSSGLVAILGPCAMTNDIATIEEEGRQLFTETSNTRGLWITHRMPPWKPRTNPEDWHGEETVNPEGAYATIVRQAINGAGVSIEIGHMNHAERYGQLTVLDWFGGRNIENGALMDAVAVQHPDLPLAVKNGLDGSIDRVMEHVSRLNSLRSEDDGPVILLYRGGENAKTPEDWERQYREALVATKGAMIVDIAHGSEMAHDPNGGFKKSVTGQIRALEHVLHLAELGESPSGIMAEASSAFSPTDPHMPFDIALQGVRRLHQLRMSGQPSLAAV